MSISKQLEKTNMAECRLGKDSDVLQTAINDICSGIDSEKCSGCGLCQRQCPTHSIQLENGKARLAGSLFCGGVTDVGDIESSEKLREAFEMGKRI